MVKYSKDKSYQLKVWDSKSDAEWTGQLYSFDDYNEFMDWMSIITDAVTNQLQDLQLTTSQGSFIFIPAMILQRSTFTIDTYAKTS